MANEPARVGNKWTQKELEYLRDKYGIMGLKGLARNLQRTESAIYAATKNLLHQKLTDNFYSANELARVLAIPCHKTIIHWFQQGWLKGRRALYYYRGPNRLWRFTLSGVVKCLRRRPWLVNIHRMEEHYLRSVVIKEWERDPWYTAAQVGPLLGLKDYRVVRRYINRGWLPAEKKPGFPWQGVWIIRDSAIKAFLANDPRPGHRHDAISTAYIRRLKREGRPTRVALLWQLECPKCGVEVEIMAPPQMIGPQVRQKFIDVYVNGNCSHGSECRISLPHSVQENFCAPQNQ